MSDMIQTTSKGDLMESVVIGGDLSKLQPEQRVSYYKTVCDSLGLNSLTRPFEYITLNGKLTLYARKDATDQLRNIHSVSIGKPDITFQDEWIIVTVMATSKDGRTDSDIGVVNKKDMRGDFGNALMKAVTKAKRRVTLSICGLGMLDETEIETIPTAKAVIVDDNGELLPEPAPSNGKQAETVASTNKRPYLPAVVRMGIQEKATKKHAKAGAPTDAQINLLRYGLELAFAGDTNADDKRHTLLNYLTGDTSTKAITGPMFKAIVEDWLKMTKDSGGDYTIDPMAAKEAQAIVSAALVDEGQQTLL